MSSATPPLQPTTPPVLAERQEIVIVSHSNLFYWWPVWLLGFILALLTLIGNHVMAVVPADSEAKRNWRVETSPGELQTREGVLVRAGKDEKHRLHLPPDKMTNNVLPDPDPPHLKVTTSKGFGVLYTIVLLVVIVITNVPLRGMWSVVVIMLIVLMSIIFALADLWEPIIRQVSLLDIRINMGGYLLISTGLLILWVLTFFFFDRQMYIKFTPGQLRVCTEIGGGEKVYDTMGMTVEKQRSDLFRHWILGLGSGDLIVKTSGANAQHIDLHNVLFIGKKVAQIEEMLRKRNVIETKG